MKKATSPSIFLVLVLISACSGNVNFAVTNEKSTDPSAKILQKQKTFLSTNEISKLEKEYSQFKTMSFSKTYLEKKLNLWRTLGSTYDMQLAREIEFARIKHPDLYCTVMGESGNNLKTYITGVSATATTEVYKRKAGQPSFAAFLDTGCSPPVNVILVKFDAPGPTHDGTSWNNAFTSLQVALTHTNTVSGKDIWVAGGSYKPGTLTSDTFQLKDGVRIYGGFAGTEVSFTQRTLGSYETILSGDLNNSSSSNSGDSDHVVTGITGATIDGVSIKYGYAVYGGGGMVNINASPAISNVTFSSNRAESYGGGLYSGGSSSPALTNVIFSNNSAKINGGGFYNDGGLPVLTDVDFISNSADNEGGGLWNHNSAMVLTGVNFNSNLAKNGGGMCNFSSSPSTLNNVTFSNNTATVAAGGMWIYSSSPTLNNVTFNSNTAVSSGGMFNYLGSPTMNNVIFSGNSATNGGGLFNYQGTPTISNAIFSNNSATEDGGAMLNDNTSLPVLTNITFSNNSAVSGEVISNNNSSILSVKNSILWQSNIKNDYSSTLKIGYSNLEGGFPAISGGTIKDITGTITLVDPSTFNAAGNINADPLFVSPLDLDGLDNIIRTSDDGLSLQSTSPARNAGTNAGAPATDIAGTTRPRPIGTGTTDMGAYEYVE